MKVSLVHNPHAGSALSKAELVEAVSALGWKVKAFAMDDLKTALRRGADAVVVAGGDGTVGKVVKRLIGTGVPVALVPMGTANNVARSLGLDLDPKRAIAALKHARVRDVDVGTVRIANRKEEHFLEAFGVGLFAWVMAKRSTRKSKKLRRAFSLLAAEIIDYESQWTTIEVDGRDVSGDCVLAAVMNLRSLGPALGLAPHAEVDDGLLDVVLVRAEHRDAFRRHLERGPVESKLTVPHLEVQHGKHIRVRSPEKWAHVDDRTRRMNGQVDIRVNPRAVRLLAPA